VCVFVCVCVCVCVGMCVLCVCVCVYVCVCVCFCVSEVMSTDAGHSECSLFIVHQDEVLGLCKFM